MQRELENRKLATDAQREAHEWKLLTRRLRRMGLNQAAMRLERAVDANANLDMSADCTIHRTRPAP